MSDHNHDLKESDATALRRIAKESLVLDERIAELEETNRLLCRDLDETQKVVEARDESIAKLEEALQNISNGDTPWMDSDGCHTTPAEIYQKYAKQVLAQRELQNGG